MRRYILAALLIVGSAALTGVATVAPCPTEDSSNCYWDASESGNGLGHDVRNP